MAKKIYININKTLARHVDLEGDVDDIIALLSSYKEEALKDGWEEVYIESDFEYGCYGDRDRDFYNIVASRKETEEERAARLKEARDLKKKQKEKEIAELEKLVQTHGFKLVKEQ